MLGLYGFSGGWGACAGLDAPLPSCINIAVAVCGPGKRPRQQPGVGVQLTVPLLTRSPPHPPEGLHAPMGCTHLHTVGLPPSLPWPMGACASARAASRDDLLTCMGGHSWDPPRTSAARADKSQLR